jgi:hypothetical protein
MRFLLSIATLALMPAAFGGTIVLNENFDELTPGPTQTSIGAFTAINGTNVDVVGGINGSYFPSLCVSPESGNCIDMDGTGGNPVGVLQSNTAFGIATYLLSFDLIGSQRGSSASVTVTFGNYDQTFTLASGDDSSGVVVNALVTVSGTASNLVFTSTDPAGDLTGALLDNVCLVRNASNQVTNPAAAGSACAAATPEPASGFLMLAGLPLLWFARRLTR